MAPVEEVVVTLVAEVVVMPDMMMGKNGTKTETDKDCSKG